MMGLANLDGSFTMTLYMHEEGPVSFANLKTREAVAAFFDEHYKSAVPLMPSYLDDFLNNPVVSSTLCLSVGRSVGRFVGRSVCRLVGL